MKNLRTGTPPPETWGVEEVMAHLGCDKTTARNLMEECRKRNGIKGYGDIEKHIFLDFINTKQREEREREARYNADIATVRQVTALEEQVKALRAQTSTLQEMCRTSSADAVKARTQSLVANFISLISVAVAVIALVLN